MEGDASIIVDNCAGSTTPRSKVNVGEEASPSGSRFGEESPNRSDGTGRIRTHWFGTRGIDWLQSVGGVECAAMSVSRRNLFSKFLKPLQAGSRKAAASVGRHEADGGSGGASALERTTRVAVIQGRYCLAYQGSFCSVCYERCPVPYAIQLNEGMPRIVLETCTGCGVCQEVCPAPQNAVLITERKPGFGA